MAPVRFSHEKSVRMQLKGRSYVEKVDLYNLYICMNNQARFAANEMPQQMLAYGRCSVENSFFRMIRVNTSNIENNNLI